MQLEPSDRPPFQGGWIIALAYELGRVIEPVAVSEAKRMDAAWPWSVALWRGGSKLAYDHVAGMWWGEGRGCGKLLRELEERCAGNAGDREFRLDDLGTLGTREDYVAAVRRGVEYIHAGDCFQVNLAHRIGAGFSGSTRSLFREMLARAAPWYGAYLEMPGGPDLHAALSVSPELFLNFDARTRLVTTRPIKGTRAGDVNPEELLRSGKDQAELNMIVDLMRNDLGRVCRVGTVRVVEERVIERHGAGVGVHHGVATVQGELRAGLGAADLLRATFPAGSITGAPKVRAMQIIEELEPAARGLYTGAIGYISDCGDMCLNVVIRTAVVRGRRAASVRLDDIESGELVYGAGAGIVAESNPEREWQETLDKAGVLWGLGDGQQRVRGSAREQHKREVLA